MQPSKAQVKVQDQGERIADVIGRRYRGALFFLTREWPSPC